MHENIMRCILYYLLCLTYVIHKKRKGNHRLLLYILIRLQVHSLSDKQTNLFLLLTASCSFLSHTCFSAKASIDTRNNHQILSVFKVSKLSIWQTHSCMYFKYVPSLCAYTRTASIWRDYLMDVLFHTTIFQSIEQVNLCRAKSRMNE